MRRRRFLSVVQVVLASFGLMAVGLVVVPGVAHAAKAAKAVPKYYVSLGDSYSVGYQPGIGATAGYTGYVAVEEHLRLANFGCGGATTTSIVDQVGCVGGPPAGTGRVAYPTSTQAAAAEAFIRAHPGKIGLITVSIGGNDVTACASAKSPITCVAAAVVDIKTNVGQLATALRAVAGPAVPIIGLTYPDVILGQYVYPTRPASAARLSLAALSVVAFKTLINPSLKSAYAAAGGNFVDVTSATGAYTPLTRTVKLKPYGTVPVAVANVCKLTWYCTQGNIHATTKGYTLIGGLVAAKYATVHRA